jgi:uncharacterized membrane protein YfcA
MDMLGLLADLPGATLVAATAIVLFAGFVKGAVGFAMPMIIISGLGSILPAETALAALILPTLVTNGRQALRGGWQGAWAAVKRYRLFLAALLVFLVGSAQLVGVIPSRALFLVIGVPLVIFAVLQLAGWVLRLDPRHRRRDEMLIGGFAGFMGGMSGIWGPPTVMYLAATDAPKSEAMRVQGVIYGIGSVALLAAHLRSGVLNAQTLPLSLAAIVPALAGMALGYVLHDRMPQATFRRAMLVVLAIAGLNLVRRGLMA